MTTIHVTTPTPCADPTNRHAFDRVIDLTAAPKPKGIDSHVVRNAVNAAAAICGGCPERVQCLTVHGDDPDLGVIGGIGPNGRHALFSKATA